jgi:hypothetical protein
MTAHGLTAVASEGEVEIGAFMIMSAEDQARRMVGFGENEPSGFERLQLMAERDLSWWTAHADGRAPPLSLL